MNNLQEKNILSILPNELIANILGFFDCCITGKLFLLSLFEQNVTEKNKSIFTYMFKKNLIVEISEVFVKPKDNDPRNEVISHFGLLIRDRNENGILTQLYKQNIPNFAILGKVLTILDNFGVMNYITFNGIYFIEPYLKIDCFKNVQNMYVNFKTRIFGITFNSRMANIIPNNSVVFQEINIDINDTSIGIVPGTSIVFGKKIIVSESKGTRKFTLKNIPKLKSLVVVSSYAKKNFRKFIIDIDENVIESLSIANVDTVDFGNTVFPKLKTVRVGNNDSYFDSHFIEKIKSVEKVILLYPFPKNYSFIENLPNLKSILFNEKPTFSRNPENKEKIKEQKNLSRNELLNYSSKKRKIVDVLFFENDKQTKKRKDK